MTAQDDQQAAEQRIALSIAAHGVRLDSARRRTDLRRSLVEIERAAAELCKELDTGRKLSGSELVKLVSHAATAQSHATALSVLESLAWALPDQ